MAQRVVFHAGFHKTGTTTIQRAMWKNRQLLRHKGIHVRTRDDMIGLCEAARGWSLAQSPLDLSLVTYEAAELAQKWAESDSTILASSEDLAGHMPGRHDLQTYAACPTLLATIAEAFTSVSPRVELHFVFTTRAPEPWLASCHAQHIRASRMTLDAATYATRFAASARLEDIVAKVRSAQPHPVSCIALEDHADAPLTPLAALAGLRPPAQARLAPVPAANTRADASVLEELLALNRSDLSRDALAAAKRALLDATD